MHKKDVKHTIDIFEKMAQNLPPLLPDAIKKEVEHGLEHLQNDASLSLDDVEEVVISLGKKVWPYWKAFDEFIDLYEGKLGEKFLLGKLPLEMKKRYKEFKEYGGGYRDLYSGHPAEFFTYEERLLLCEALVDVDGDIRRHVAQSVLSTNKEKYQDRIVEFQTILDDIEKRLDTLRLMADDEGEHPQIAEEIREQVRAFEQGLCLLAPHTRYEAVCSAEDYFDSRREHKNLFRS